MITFFMASIFAASALIASLSAFACAGEHFTLHGSGFCSGFAAGAFAASGFFALTAPALSAPAPAFAAPAFFFSTLRPLAGVSFFFVFMASNFHVVYPPVEGLDVRTGAQTFYRRVNGWFSRDSASLGGV